MDIVELIKNPLFNHSALAELLYGSRESKNRAKVSKNRAYGIFQSAVKKYSCGPNKSVNLQLKSPEVTNYICIYVYYIYMYIRI